MLKERREPTRRWGERLIEVPAWFRASVERFPDLYSAIRKEFASVQEAQEYAGRLGVTAAYGDNLPIANFVNELLAQLQERGIDPPLSVVVDNRFFGYLGETATATIAMAENGVLFINPSADFWRDPSSFARAVYEARIWSTPHPLHPLYHEVGHLQQEERGTRGKGLTPRERTEAKAISHRATEGVDEFVAEVYAGLYVGVKYDPEILRIFTRYGGKKP